MHSILKLITLLWPILKPLILPIVIREMSKLQGAADNDPELRQQFEDWKFFWRKDMTFTEAQSAAKELQRLMRSV